MTLEGLYRCLKLAATDNKILRGRAYFGLKSDLATMSPNRNPFESKQYPLVMMLPPDREEPTNPGNPLPPMSRVYFDLQFYCLQNYKADGTPDPLAEMLFYDSSLRKAAFSMLRYLGDTYRNQMEIRSTQFLDGLQIAGVTDQAACLIVSCTALISLDEPLQDLQFDNLTSADFAAIAYTNSDPLKLLSQYQYNGATV